MCLCVCVCVCVLLCVDRSLGRNTFLRENTFLRKESARCRTVRRQAVFDLVVYSGFLGSEAPLIHYYCEIDAALRLMDVAHHDDATIRSRLAMCRDHEECWQWASHFQHQTICKPLWWYAKQIRSPPVTTMSHAMFAKLIHKDVMDNQKHWTEGSTWCKLSTTCRTHRRDWVSAVEWETALEWYPEGSDGRFGVALRILKRRGLASSRLFYPFSRLNKAVAAIRTSICLADKLFQPRPILWPNLRTIEARTAQYALAVVEAFFRYLPPRLLSPMTSALCSSLLHSGVSVRDETHLWQLVLSTPPCFDQFGFQITPTVWAKGLRAVLRKLQYWIDTQRTTMALAATCRFVYYSVTTVHDFHDIPDFSELAHAPGYQACCERRILGASNPWSTPRRYTRLAGTASTLSMKT